MLNQVKETPTVVIIVILVSYVTIIRSGGLDKGLD